MPPVANHRAPLLLGGLGGPVGLPGGGDGGRRPQRDVAERGQQFPAGEAGDGDAVEEGAEEAGDALGDGGGRRRQRVGQRLLLYRLRLEGGQPLLLVLQVVLSRRRRQTHF